MLLLSASLLFAIFIYSLYYYFTRTFNYWKLRKVQGPPPLPFFGNIKDFVLRKENTAIIYKQLYDAYPYEKVVGIYRMTTPCLLIRDPDIIKQIFVKDFDIFADRGIEFSADYLGINLFHAKEDVWRPLRNRFTPMFSSQKLKNLVYLVVECGNAFVDCVEQALATQEDPQLSSIVQKYSVSTISACAFGLDVDIGNNKFIKTFNKIDDLIFKRNYLTEVDMMFPGILKNLNFSLFPKELANFFKDLVKNVIRIRNNKPSNRNDFMDLILEMRQDAHIMSAKNSECEIKSVLEVTDEVIAAQAFLFYGAGYETSASAMIFTLYELAMNLDIQEKIIAEIDQTLERHNGNITYETVCEMSYMEKVFKETLRKYPVIDPYQRVAKTDYEILGTNVTVKKGQIVIITPLGLHRDKKYYSNPETFDPERFSPENVAKRHQCTYLPFSLGPKNCIGMRFAKLQSFIGLLKLFSKFRLMPSKSTPRHVSFNPNRIVLCPNENLFLQLIPRHDIKIKHP